MTFQAVAISLSIIVAPGLGAVLAFYRPDEAKLPTQLGLTFAFGFGLVALTAFLLSLLSVLNAVTFYLVLGGETVALWAFALRRSSPMSRIRAIGDQIREDPWPLIWGSVIVVVAGVLLLRMSPLLNFGQTAPWRYWADGMEIADAGQVPEATIHYGRLFVPTVSKVVFNSFNAALSFSLSGPLQAMGALLWIFSVGLVINLWALGRELGLRFTAILLPLVTVLNARFLNPEMALDLQRFTAENAGRLASVAALIVAVRSIRDKSMKGSIAAGVLFAVATGTHMVPVLVSLALLGGYALARILVERSIVPVAKHALVVVAISGALTGGNLTLSGGDVGFEGATGSNTYAGFERLLDPTRFLSLGFANQAPEFDPEARAALYDGWYDPPGFLIDQLVAAATGREVIYEPPPVSQERHPTVYLVPLLLIGSAVAMLIWFPRDLKHMGLMAGGLAGLLILVTLFFSYYYETFVPARFGARRLHDYASLPLVLVGLGLLEAGIGLLPTIRRWLQPAVAGVLVVIVAAVTISAPGPPEETLVRGRRSLEAIDWVRANIPCDARLLVSRRTAGTFQAMTGRVSVTEGMTPFLRPDMLKTVSQLLLEASAFFEQPRRNEDFLTAENIDYVVVIKGPVLGSEASHMRTVAHVALDNVDFLTKVGEIQPVDFYRVTGLSKASGFPSRDEVPGRPCSDVPVS